VPKALRQRPHRTPAPVGIRKQPHVFDASEVSELHLQRNAAHAAAHFGNAGTFDPEKRNATHRAACARARISDA
jgi:hypothetical protein